jgi:hypothetical protein
MTPRASILLLLCACNRWLSLDDVLPRDAPIDAARQCPEVGVVPKYSSSITQYAAYNVQSCAYFQIDRARDHAITRCYDPPTCGEDVYEGPPTGPFTLALPATFFGTKLDPDGTLLYTYDLTANQLESLRRDATGWVADDVLPLGTTTISTIARVDGAVHVLAYTNDVAGMAHVQEWVGVDHTWTPQGTDYTQSMLGLAALDTDLDLSSDGLRLLALGIAPGDAVQRTYYFDRASVADRFGPARLLDIQPIRATFITDDCTQIFFSALDRVLYFERQ